MHNREKLGYRNNVSGFIINPENKILLCKRIGHYTDWQIPQGGIDPGETAEQAVLRELEEEVNLVNPLIISKAPFSLNYEWPDDLLDRGFRGQNQTAFLLTSPNNWIPDFTKGPEIEFSEYKWVNKEVFLELTKETFRFETYSKFIEYFSAKIDFNITN